MKRLSRAVSGLLAVLLLAFSLTACAASRPVYASPRAGKVVATVGDVKILYEELYFITMNYIEELKLSFGEDALLNEEHRLALESFVWSSLYSREAALISLGYEYGIDVYKGDIADSVQSEMDNAMEKTYENDRGAYIDSLAAMHMTDHYARKYFGVEHYLANAIVLEMLYRGELMTDDAAIREAIYGEAFVRTVHVFIDTSSAAYTPEQHLAHANEVRAEIAAAQTDAARHEAMCRAIGGKYNNDFNDPLGNGYYFTRGEMDEAYENAAFALAEYQVSDVVKTDEGYYIIMRLPKVASYIEENFEALKGQSYFVMLNQRVEEKLSTMTLAKTKFGEGLDLTALPPIDPNGGTTVIVISSIAAGLLLGGAFALGFVKFYRRRHAKS